MPRKTGRNQRITGGDSTSQILNEVGGDWLTISNNAQSAAEDVTRIHNHPLVPHDIAIYGDICDVKSGKLVEVPEATANGKAQAA